jgi:hypothetical protein
MVKLFALALVAAVSLAGGRKAPVVVVDEPAKPTPCVAPAKQLVVFGLGAASSLKPGGVDYKYGQDALCEINHAYASGCLEQKVLAWPFLSLHGVVEPALKPSQKAEAYRRLTAQAPHAVDARWYSKWGSTIGYTYNYRDEDGSGISETRVWTNTRNIGNAEMYAAHLTHELSHQARAGGFVHYSYHQGSAPYELGDIVSECIGERKAGKWPINAK